MKKQIRCPSCKQLILSNNTHCQNCGFRTDHFRAKIPKNFKVNEFITLKFKDNKTYIYVKGELFRQCKFLMLNIHVEEVSSFDDIESIDEVVEKLDSSMERRGRHQLEIPAETEFWGHCSNMQVWAENSYNTRLLHRNIAFPLLKKLTEKGDKLAISAFKEEIAKRLLSGSPIVFEYLRRQNYFSYLNKKEFRALLTNRPFRKIIMEKFFSVFSILESFANQGSTLAKKIIWKKSLKLFKEGEISVVEKILNLGYFDNVSIKDFEPILLGLQSRFRRNLQTSMYDNVLGEQAFQVFFKLMEIGSKETRIFLRNQFVRIFKENKETDLTYITKYLCLLSREELDELIEYIRPKHFNNLINPFTNDLSQENRDSILISKLGRRAFRFMYFLIENAQENQKKLIIDLFHHNYFKYLENDFRLEFIKDLNPNLSKIFLKCIFETLLENFKIERRNGKSHYHHLLKPLSLLISLKNDIWNILFKDHIELKRDDEILQLTIFLLVNHCFDLLESEQVVPYFDHFKIEDMGNILMGNLDNPENNSNLDAKGFLKLQKKGVKLLFYLITKIKWVEWEFFGEDYFSHILKNFHNRYPELVGNQIINILKNFEKFQNETQFDFYFNQLIPLLNKKDRIETLTNPDFNLFGKISDIEEETKFYGLLKLLDFFPSVIEQIQFIGNILIKKKTISDDLIYELIQPLFEKVDCNQLQNLVLDVEKDFINKILNRFSQGDSFNYFASLFIISIFMNLNNFEGIKRLFSDFPQTLKFEVLDFLIEELFNFMGEINSEIKTKLRIILTLTKPKNILRLLFLSMQQTAMYPEFYEAYHKMYLDALEFLGRDEGKQSRIFYDSGEYGGTYITKNRETIGFNCDITLPDGKQFIGGYIDYKKSIVILNPKNEEIIATFKDTRRDLDKFAGDPIFYIPNTNLLVVLFKNEFAFYGFGDKI